MGLGFYRLFLFLFATITFFVEEGSSMLPFHDSPRETWYYCYFEGTLTDSRQKLLFIYLDDSLYDGYMWFSSLPE